MYDGSSKWVQGSGGKAGGHLLLPPHLPTALPRQCYEHTLVYKKVTRFCLPHHLWTSLYIVVRGFRERGERLFGVFIRAS